jgi:type VI protein secretion system component VasK
LIVVSTDSIRREDPLLVSARREALAVLFLWLAFFGWTIGYSALYGYGPQPEVGLVWGIPSWVMWGVFVPWTVCTIASTWLAWRFIADDDLGCDSEETSDPETGHYGPEVARETDDG